jgi:hypothetical protein
LRYASTADWMAATLVPAACERVFVSQPVPSAHESRIDVRRQQQVVGDGETGVVDVALKLLPNLAHDLI